MCLQSLIGNALKQRNCHKVCMRLVSTKYKCNRTKKLQQLEEAKRMLETERMVRVEGDNLLNQAQTEITELRNTTGRLQLEFKEKELYVYCLAEEKNKCMC